jgi:hypothetical protein
LGYEPQDNAERFADAVAGELDDLQGGRFTSREAGGWAVEVD